MAAPPLPYDGFSIREFTAKIRAMDVEKCWPFDGNPKEMKKELVDELLPPLTWKKFRLCSDEESEKAGFEKPPDEELVLEEGKLEVFDCCSSLRTHIDRCLKAKEKKMKIPRRKRSIVEIFAKTIDDNEEILANVRKRRKKKKRKLVEIAEKGSKKKGLVKKGGSWKKEKTHKLNGSMQLAVVGKLKSSVKGKKKLISKRKSSSSKHNVMKIILASKFTKKKQKPTGKSIHGILKKCGCVTRKRSMVGNMQSGDPKKRCQRVDKHVSFSGKDHILGQSSSTSSDEVLSDHMVLSSLLEEEDNVSPIEPEEVDEGSKEIMPEVGNQGMKENEVAESCSLDSRISHRGQGLSDESVKLTSQPQENLCQFSHDEPMSSRTTSFLDISWVRDSVEKCGVPTQASSAMDSMISATSESSTLSITRANEYNGCNMQRHPYLELSPKDLMTRICSLMDSTKQKTPSCGNKFINNDFVGLPLNSQGELIKMNRLRKESMNGCTETSLPDENHDIPSKVSRPTHQLDLDLNKMSISSCACNHFSQPQNQIDKENDKLVEKSDSGVFSNKQQTMRLMGKDVVVGRNNKDVQGSEEGKVWTDKNVIKEQRGDTLVGTSSLSRNFEMNASSGEWKETSNQSLGPRGVPMESYLPQMNAVDPRFSYAYHNWQPNMMPQGHQHLTMENLRVQMLPFSGSLPSEQLMTRNFGMQSELPNFRSHIRSFASPQYPQYPCQCTRPYSTQLLYEQDQAHSSSCFRFPFVSQSWGNCAQQSRPQTLPHWMPNMSPHNESPFAPSEYSTRAQNHPSNYFTSMVSQPLQQAKSFAFGRNSSDMYPIQHPPIPAPPSFRSNTSINDSYRNRSFLKNLLKPQTVRRKDLDRAKRTKKMPTDKVDNLTKHARNPLMPVGRSDLSQSLIHKGASRRDANGDNLIEVEPSLRSSIQNSQASVLDANRSSPAVFSNSNMDTAARPGPTKLSAGAKHILKPSPNPDQESTRLIHSTVPFGLVGNSDKVSELQKKPSKIYKL